MENRGLEPLTSCMPCFERTESDPTNTRAKSDSPEALHQMLHQIGELIENYGAEVLFDALAELLGKDGCQRLSEAISRRVAKE